MNNSTSRFGESGQSEPRLARWRKRAAITFLPFPCFILALGLIATSSARANESEANVVEEEQIDGTERFDDETDYRDFGAAVFVSREDDRRGPPHRGPGFRGRPERGGKELGPRERDVERIEAKKGNRGGDLDRGSKHARKGPPNRSKALAKHHKAHGSHARCPHSNFAHRGGKPGDHFAHKGPPRHGRPGFANSSSRGFSSFARGGFGGHVGFGRGGFSRGSFGPPSFVHRGGKPGSFARGHASKRHRGPSQFAHHRGPHGHRSHGRGPHFSGLQSRGHFAARGSFGGFGPHGFGSRGVGAHGRSLGGYGRGEHGPATRFAGADLQGNQRLIRLVAQLSKEVKELRAEVKSLKDGRGGDGRKNPPRDKDSKGDHKDGKKDAKQVRGEFRGGDDGPRGPRFMHAEFGGRGFGSGGFGGPRFGHGFDGQRPRPGFRPSQDREHRESKSLRGPGGRFEEDDDTDI